MDRLKDSKAFCSALVSSLYDQGVRDLVSCPGGRSAELLKAFIEHGQFQIESLYDERSAGFYALGKSLKTKKPVVVLTTSGSAVAGLYPAALEAAYQQNAKLVLLTADRPENLRGTGAPQTIHQVDFFKTNGIKTVEVKKLSDVENMEQSIHLNICLPEPNPRPKSRLKLEVGAPLLIVSSLLDEEREAVLDNFREYKGVLLLEALSNLNESDFPKATVLRFPDLFFSKIDPVSFTSLYRLGGVPVSKVWREVDSFEAYYWDVYKFSGGAHVKALDLQSLKEKLFSSMDLRPDFTKANEAFKKNVTSFIDQHPQSEVSQLSKIVKEVPEGSQVFIGNSLPIREFESVDSSKFKKFGQRGVNGIDGSLALFLGQLSKTQENWIFLGDLTTLYNLNDFQVLKNIKDHKIRIVVLNNSGGQIFSRIFKKHIAHFANQQEVSFKTLAKFWNIGYVKAFTEHILPLKVLIELPIDNTKSLELSETLKELKF